MPLRSARLPFVLLASVALAGCDDVALLDVGSGGEVLVAADAAGLCPLTADASEHPRHLFWVSADGERVRRLTARPRPLSWPRALGSGALWIEERSRLVVRAQEGEPRILYRSRKHLHQPAVSPDGRWIAVQEAQRLGTSGRLLLLNLEGSVLGRFERALLGHAFTREGRLAFLRSRDERNEPFASGPGEVALFDPDRGVEQVLFRGVVPGATCLEPASNGRLVALLPLEGAEGPLGLALLSSARRGARRGQTGAFDFWPSLDARSERILFTRSDPSQPEAFGELRLAPVARPGASTALNTPGPVASPRWLSPQRIAFITRDGHLVLQDIDGQKRKDLTDRLRAAYASEESR
ncbi:MAG: hypothetical protein D6731_25755 [Planctomycetota bacterium]|nr:MAG: hypothetical protein D6731_25755 [Planctomycetota bacterium]